MLIAIAHLSGSHRQDEQQQILDENSDLIAPELIQVLKILAQDAGARGQEELKDSLQNVSGLIEARLAS